MHRRIPSWIAPFVVAASLAAAIAPFAANSLATESAAPALPQLGFQPIIEPWGDQRTNSFQPIIEPWGEILSPSRQDADALAA